eukprot:m.93865 g.93865  ORF g.93865 m.93865 type:complete len:76 (+) comp36803_c0_seq18:807-1034(+)
MDKHLFNLKFAAKQLDRNAKKCDKEEKAEKVKLKRVKSCRFSSYKAEVFLRQSEKETWTEPEFTLKIPFVRRTKH